MMQNVTVRGADIPALGLGMFRMTEDEVRAVVPAALEAGFRHFDTAQAYENEAALGQALRAAGAERDTLFLTTKVWVTSYDDARFMASVRESLDRLGVDRVDLLLAHWPGRDVPVARQVEWLEQAQAQGLTRSIGVSNYNRGQMVQAAEAAPIVTNQVEIHPYLDQSALAQAAAAAGVSLTAYYGMADGAVPQDAVLAGIGAKYDKTAAQVALRWLVQQGFVALTKTAQPARLAQNIDIFDFALDAQDMGRIAALARPDGRLVDPQGLAPDWNA